MGTPAPRPWRRVIGIVGGLGPHAHLELEREILRAAEPAAGDQDYPAWILASLPRTPDRTAALCHGGDSPVPLLESALEAIAGRADFALIACVTAHAFLPELRPRVALPVLDLVAEAIAVARAAGHRRLGLLATTGTLRSAVFPRAARAVAADASLVSPLDLPRGARLQDELVMRPIYGPPDGGGASLKSGGASDPARRERLAAPLREAVRRLADAGAEAILLGCTEIPLALGHAPVAGVPLVDPLRTAAAAAVEIAAGRRDLPSSAGG